MRYLLSLMAFLWLGTLNVRSQVLVTVSDGTTLDVCEQVIDGVFDYGWGSTVYTQSQIGAANTLSSICWYLDEENIDCCGGCTNCNWTFNNVSVYLAHYNQTVFPDDVRPTAAYSGVTNWTLVFYGNINFGGIDTWQGVSFGTSFNYNGTDNLLVHIESNDGSGTVSAPWFWYMSDPVTTNYRNKSKWQNGSFPAGNADNPGSLSRYKYAQVKFNLSCNKGTLLPVELLSFDARCAGDAVRMEWATATEKDNSHFTIERSVNGRDFLPVGVVEGSGTTSTMRYYSFNEGLPADIEKEEASAVYYRLSQTDYDGKTEKLGIVSVPANCEDPEDQKISFHPNPMAGLSMLHLPTIAKNGVLRIFNATGECVLEFRNIAGSWFRLNGHSLAPGIYTVVFSDGARSFKPGKLAVSGY